MEDKSDCGLCHDFTFHIRPASHALIQYQSPGPPYQFLLLSFSFAVSLRQRWLYVFLGLPFAMHRAVGGQTGRRGVKPG